MNFFSGPVVRAIIADRNGPAVTRGLGKVPKDATVEYFCRRLAYGLETAEDGECWLYLIKDDECRRSTLCVGEVSHPVARLAYLLAKGPIRKGQYILHSCDVPTCINPSHLRAGTPSDNMRDKYERGSFENQVKGYTHSLVAAKRLNIAPIRFRELTKSGDIPSVRLGMKGIWVPDEWVREQARTPEYFI